MAGPRPESTQKSTAFIVVLAVGLFLSGFSLVGAGRQSGSSSLATEMATDIDTIFADYDKSDTPGCAVGILKDGTVVFARGYGLANLEYDVPITPDTIFEAGSVSKQFAVGAIQILAEEGKLSLDDDIRKFVPEVPDFGTLITIRHLMSHTSGLRDQWGLLRIAGREAGSVVHTLDEILDLVNRQRDLNFPPGEDYLYSNTNFSLLAWIVWRASGQSLADFCVERIFRPLGMNRTQWRDDYTEIVKGRATAYSKRGSEFHQNMPFTNVYGNGGLLTTVGDLLLWAKNFWNPQVIGSARLEEMETPGKLSDGTPIGYALGLRVSDYRGLREVNHSGSTAGYRAFLARYPDEKVAIALLSNFASVRSGDLVHRVADIVLAGRLKDRPKPEIITVSLAELKNKTGLFRNTKTDAILALAVREGRLVLAGGGRARALLPISSDRFVAENGTEYVFFQEGKAGIRVRLVPRGDPPSDYTRVEPFSPSTEKLSGYSGRYWSAELEVYYTVAVKDGKLTIRHRPEPARILDPSYENAFIVRGASGSLLVRFTRNSSGAVDGMSVYAGRVRHLKFSKIEESPLQTAH